jgi:hypothetical protein
MLNTPLLHHGAATLDKWGLGCTLGTRCRRPHEPKRGREVLLHIRAALPCRTQRQNCGGANQRMAPASLQHLCCCAARASPAAARLAKQDRILSALARERRSWTMSTPRPHTANKPKPMTANGPITAAQAATSKRLPQAAYELDAFKSNPHPRRGGYAHRDANG